MLLKLPREFYIVAEMHGTVPAMWMTQRMLSILQFVSNYEDTFVYAELDLGPRLVMYYVGWSWSGEVHLFLARGCSHRKISTTWSLGSDLTYFLYVPELDNISYSEGKPYSTLGELKVAQRFPTVVEIPRGL